VGRQNAIASAFPRASRVAGWRDGAGSVGTRFGTPRRDEARTGPSNPARCAFALVQLASPMELWSDGHQTCRAGGPEGWYCVVCSGEACLLLAVGTQYSGHDGTLRPRKPPATSCEQTGAVPCQTYFCLQPNDREGKPGGRVACSGRQQAAPSPCGTRWGWARRWATGCRRPPPAGGWVGGSDEFEFGLESRRHGHRTGATACLHSRGVCRRTRAEWRWVALVGCGAWRARKLAGEWPASG